MKFTPRPFRTNVNISRTHPLIEFLWLTGGLVLVVGILFIALGLITDLVVARIPVNMEKWLGEQAIQQFSAKPNAPLQRRLDSWLSTIPESSGLPRYQFKILLSDTPEVNAIAIPGGHIIVFSGLIQKVESENELAMIVYHELGHFAHRDHLRGLGRGLSLTVASMILFGSDSAANDVIAKTLISFQANYSQAQESAADQFGIEMLNRYYHHITGATDFFTRLAEKDSYNIPYLLASHPHPDDRIAKLNYLIEEKGYKIGKSTPLYKDIQ